MNKNVFIFALIILVSCFSFVYAGPKASAAARAKHADKNNDGTVDRKEIKMEKNWEHQQKAKVNTGWEKKADTDQDGVVEKSEAASLKDRNNDGVVDAVEKQTSWQHGRAKVNNEVEKKYDTNSDGWLQPEESKALIADKHELIKTEGKAKVDSAVEAQYDDDKDGVINANEAKVMLDEINK